MKTKLIEKTTCKSVYEINGTTILIWTIVGGQIATSLLNYKQTSRWNQIPDNKTIMDSPEISWIEKQDDFENWLKSAIIKQTEIDKRPQIEFSEAFKASSNEILIVNVKLKNHVSISARLISPITEKTAIEINDQTIEDLEIDPDDNSYDDYADYIGTTEFFDNSLYYNEIEFNGNHYLFKCDAFGCLHDEIKQYTNKFNELLDLHLKKDKESFYQAVEIVQNFSEINLDNQVEKLAIEILS